MSEEFSRSCTAMTCCELEIMKHHAIYGRVWSGDQISKSGRDALVARGMLENVEGGFTQLTGLGLSTYMSFKREIIR